MSRTEERRKAWLEAQKESLNRNGMARRDTSPISTRTAAEAAQTLNTPDTAPSPRDHSTAAGTGVVNFGGRVRDRMTVQENIPPPGQKAETWNESVERRRREVLAEGERLRAQRQQQIEVEQRARQAKVKAAKRHREIEERNQSIAATNNIRREIREILADATPAEIEVVTARVRAERCELFPDAYLIHLTLLREETEQAIRAGEQRRLEEQ